MLKYIEKFAETIVDYLDQRWKKYSKQQKKQLVKEKLWDKYISYEIIPYHLNTFDETTFSKFLNKFSSYSQRINFYICWNNSSAHLVVTFPEVLENKFVTNFYNFFPSSKIVKIENVDFEPKEYFFTMDEYLKIRDSKNFFKDFFLLFKNIPSDQTAFIRYSLILNSVWDIYYESLLEIIRKLIKLVFWWIYYFFHYIILWKPPAKNFTSKKQQVETWIKWTAISIWVGGNNTFQWLVYKYFSDNVKLSLNKKSKETFSSTKITYFAKMFHVPTKYEKNSLLSYINYKRLSPPPNLPKISKDTTILWNADWADEKIKVGLKQEDKVRHVYIIGKTWVGKSTLLSNMIFSDLKHWNGLALIDPHWDLVETVLRIIPENRIDDVVLFDVSDVSHSVGFNPFYKLSQSLPEEKEKNKDLVVSTILSVFKKLYGYSWGPRLEYILRNVLLTLADYDKANFLDIIKILTDKKFRQYVVSQISDPVIKNFWEKEFAKRSDRFTSEAISPILNKIWQFVSSNVVRNIFGQQENTLDIQEIMDSNKILLVNLSKWLIWEDNSILIWSFIVSQVQVETMKRAAMWFTDRNYFTLYIDEFQNFATDSFVVILSEARKYNLSLVVANQYIAQIEEDIQNAIFGNVWNLIVFNSWNQDAEILAKQFKNKITVEDIVSIPKFKAYAKIMIDWTATDVFGLSTYPISQEIQKNDEFVAKLRAISNKKYTKSKKEVEEQIKASLTINIPWKSDLITNNSVESRKLKVESNALIANNRSHAELVSASDAEGDKSLPTSWNSSDLLLSNEGDNFCDKNKIICDKVQENKKTSQDNLWLSWQNQQKIEDVWDVFDWVVKLKFNYGLFVVTNKYEGLLHKKNIHLPEGINWKDYYNIGDKVRVKLVQLKEVDGQVKAVWESVS